MGEDAIKIPVNAKLDCALNWHQDAAGGGSDQPACNPVPNGGMWDPNRPENENKRKNKGNLLSRGENGGILN